MNADRRQRIALRRRYAGGKKTRQGRKAAQGIVKAHRAGFQQGGLDGGQPIPIKETQPGTPDSHVQRRTRQSIRSCRDDGLAAQSPRQVAGKPVGIAPMTGQKADHMPSRGINDEHRGIPAFMDKVRRDGAHGNPCGPDKNLRGAAVKARRHQIPQRCPRQSVRRRETGGRCQRTRPKAQTVRPPPRQGRQHGSRRRQGVAAQGMTIQGVAGAVRHPLFLKLLCRGSRPRVARGTDAFRGGRPSAQPVAGSGEALRTPFPRLHALSDKGAEKVFFTVKKGAVKRFTTEKEKAAIQFGGNAVVLLYRPEFLVREFLDENVGALGKAEFDVLNASLEKRLYLGAQKHLFLRPEVTLQEKAGLVKEIAIVFLWYAGAIAQRAFFFFRKGVHELRGALQQQLFVTATFPILRRKAFQRRKERRTGDFQQRRCLRRCIRRQGSGTRPGFGPVRLCRLRQGFRRSPSEACPSEGGGQGSEESGASSAAGVSPEAVNHVWTRSRRSVFSSGERKRRMVSFA